MEMLPHETRTDHSPHTNTHPSNQPNACASCIPRGVRPRLDPLLLRQNLVVGLLRHLLQRLRGVDGLLLSSSVYVFGFWWGARDEVSHDLLWSLSGCVWFWGLDASSVSMVYCELRQAAVVKIGYDGPQLFSSHPAPFFLPNQFQSYVKTHTCTHGHTPHIHTSLILAACVRTASSAAPSAGVASCFERVFGADI